MSHIKFAGLASEWTSAYARAYAETLYEIGMASKAITAAGKELVAYSHKPFTRPEVEKALRDLLEQEKSEGEGENPPEERL